MDQRRDALRRGARDELVTDHPLYRGKPGNAVQGAAAPRQAHGAIDQRSIQRFENALAGGWPLGDAAFLDALAQQLHRRLAPGHQDDHAKPSLPSQFMSPIY